MPLASTHRHSGKDTDSRVQQIRHWWAVSRCRNHSAYPWLSFFMCKVGIIKCTSQELIPSVCLCLVYSLTAWLLSKRNLVSYTQTHIYLRTHTHHTHTLKGLLSMCNKKVKLWYTQWRGYVVINNLWESISPPPCHLSWITCTSSIYYYTKTPWRRKWQPTPVFLPGKSRGQMSLAGYSPWDWKEMDTTEQLTLN